MAEEIEAKLDVRPMFELSPLLASLQVPSQDLERVVSASIPLVDVLSLTGLG